MTRPDSTTVANRIIAYLYRTGAFDWAGGRQAAHEKRWGFSGGPAFDFLGAFDGMKSEVINVNLSDEDVKEIRGEHAKLESHPLFYRPGQPTGSTQIPSVPLFSSRAAVGALKEPLKVDATFKLTPMLVSYNFQPVGPPQFGPEVPRRPLGFWPLIEHNYGIPFDGDIRLTLEEARRDEDTEAVEICEQLLLMKKTARDLCGRKVETELIKRRGY